MTTKTNKTYDQITAQIVEAMDRGVIPWAMPWKYVNPANGKTQKAYRGTNRLFLGMTAMVEKYQSPYFFTEKQAGGMGGTIKADQRGKFHVVRFFAFRFKWVTDEITGEKKKKTYPYYREWLVYNVDQINFPKHISQALTLAGDDRDKITDAEQIVAGIPFDLAINHGIYNKPVTHIQTGQIDMPLAGSFKDRNSYYRTLFHEMVHATAKDLKRKTGVKFGDQEYAREELVAEMGAAFLAAEAHIDPAIDNHAAYIKSWKDAITKDAGLVAYAAREAQKAADYIMGRYVPRHMRKKDKDAKTA